MLEKNTNKSQVANGNPAPFWLLRPWLLIRDAIIEHLLELSSFLKLLYKMSFGVQIAYRQKKFFPGNFFLLAQPLERLLTLSCVYAKIHQGARIFRLRITQYNVFSMRLNGLLVNILND